MNKTGKTYAIIVIGSGAGGATVAKEVAKAGRELLVIEKGNYYSSLGEFKDIVKFHDAKISTKGLRFAEQGMMLLRTFMAGGSTMVSCGNGLRCLEEELAGFGIGLDEEFKEAERELNIVPFSEDSLSEGSKAILRASQTLGYSMEYMPKFVDATICSNCGGCFAGCQNGAKWTAINYLEQAKEFGAEIIYGTSVREIIIRDGKAIGVITGNRQNTDEIFADNVILSAGGLSSPVILHQSGIDGAGSGLFVDTFVNVYGITDGLNQKNECPMALVDLEFYKDEGFILSTFVNSMKVSRFAELDARALTVPAENLLGLMVKIRDERSGCVHADGTISKAVTPKDHARLERGISVAKEILAKSGADDTSYMVSKLQGAHPGGTAAIGEVVNSRLETEVKNLYVCDGSVLPVSPGLPPILTIIALGKRLAKTLV